MNDYVALTLAKRHLAELRDEAARQRRVATARTATRGSRTRRRPRIALRPLAAPAPCCA